MKTVTQHIRQHIYDKNGVVITKAGEASMNDLLGEWIPEFEQLMRNRLIMGALRYGRFDDPEKGQYDNVGSMIRRLRLYQQTGNDELLVDIANLAMVEFAKGTHPLKHFQAGDDTEHVSKEAEG